MEVETGGPKIQVHSVNLRCMRPCLKQKQKQSMKGKSKVTRLGKLKCVWGTMKSILQDYKQNMHIKLSMLAYQWWLSSKIRPGGNFYKLAFQEK